MKITVPGRMTVFVEGILLIVMSLVAIVEGLRLIIFKDPYTLYDPLGPGYYALTVGTCLLGVGIFYIIAHCKNPPQMEMVPVDKKMKIRLVSTVVACGIYIILIAIVGYLLATIIFFFLEFKIEGIRSWLLVIILSLVFSGFYYLIFVRLCNMVFPTGMIFQ
jgi:hypothetical protein